uniref:Uncharacterized protein n=1 Tax=Macaca fascicularis TaxID=9541 RepID=Q8HXG7_MACFA|nr:hypothetical protein [Macaca fascicularis]
MSWNFPKVCRILRSSCNFPLSCPAIFLCHVQNCLRLRLASSLSSSSFSVGCVWKGSITGFSIVIAVWFPSQSS